MDNAKCGGHNGVCSPRYPATPPIWRQVAAIIFACNMWFIIVPLGFMIVQRARLLDLAKKEIWLGKKGQVQWGFAEIVGFNEEWTIYHRLIPDIGMYMQRMHEDVNHHITQLLTFLSVPLSGRRGGKLPNLSNEHRECGTLVLPLPRFGDWRRKLPALLISPDKLELHWLTKMRPQHLKQRR